MRLLIIRHGDPNYELDTLTPTGWLEAELLRKRLEPIEVKAFYCSPLGRARDTASLTLKAKNADAQILPWLQEFPCRVRHMDGTMDVAWDWMPADWMGHPAFYDKNHWMEHPAFAEAGLPAAVEEVKQGLDALLARHGYCRDGQFYRAEQANQDTVVLFCHFGLECLLLSHLLGISPMPLWHGTCAAPTSVTTLYTEERQKGIASFRMSAFGDTSHLYVAGREPSFSARFQETFDDAANAATTIVTEIKA